MHPTYSHPHPECEYVSLSMQGNVTEDAISSRDDVTAAHSCAQAAPGGAGRHCPAGTASRHCLAQTLMQGTTGPMQPDCTQLCKLRAGHQCDTNDNNKHLRAAFCSRTDVHNFMQGKAKCG